MGCEVRSVSAAQPQAGAAEARSKAEIRNRRVARFFLIGAAGRVNYCLSPNCLRRTRRPGSARRARALPTSQGAQVRRQRAEPRPRPAGSRSARSTTASAAVPRLARFCLALLDSLFDPFLDPSLRRLLFPLLRNRQHQFISTVQSLRHRLAQLLTAQAVNARRLRQVP